MRLLFTKNNKIGSKLIRWGTEGDCSHFSVEFDGTVILQSIMDGGVGITSTDHFLKHNDIVHELKFDLPLQDEEAIWKPLVKKLVGNSSWDFKAGLYWALQVIKHRITGSEYPKNNKWDDAKKYMCVEVAKELPDFIFGGDKPSLDFVSPQTLFHIIDAKTANLPFRVKEGT